MAIIRPQSKTTTLIKQWLKYLAIIMTRRQYSAQLITKHNKCIQLCHRQLAHISNAYVLKATKLLDEMKLNDNKEYNPVEGLIDSNNYKTSEFPNN